MKKIISALVVILLSSMLLLSGCGGGRRIESKQELTLNKKYIYDSEINVPKEKQRYYLFRGDGTGIYHYYDTSTISQEPKIYHYKIDFTYLIIDDTVVCFYDSETFFSDDNSDTKIRKDWNAVFLFSEYILMSPAQTIYICEDYLPEIPNFGKSE